MIFKILFYINLPTDLLIIEHIFIYVTIQSIIILLPEQPIKHKMKHLSIIYNILNNNSNGRMTCNEK